MASTPWSKEGCCPNTWDWGKGGTDIHWLHQGKRPTVTGTEQPHNTFGSSKFSCSFKKQLIFLPGNGHQTGRMWINTNRKFGRSGFPNSVRISR